MTRIIRYGDQPDLRWANDGGTTRALWSDRSGERRVSVAMLERLAAFSPLPGMARLLVVLDPLTIEIQIDGRISKLKRGGVLSFLGTQRVALLALDRPGRVLNVMAHMESWEPYLSLDPSSAELTGWVASDAIVWNGNRLDRGDLVIGAAPPSAMWTIAFRPVASSSASWRTGVWLSREDIAGTAGPRAARLDPISEELSFPLRAEFS